MVLICQKLQTGNGRIKRKFFHLKNLNKSEINKKTAKIVKFCCFFVVFLKILNKM